MCLSHIIYRICLSSTGSLRTHKNDQLNTHQRVPYEKKYITLKMALNLNLRVCARAHAQFACIYSFASHMEEITGKFLHIYRSFYLLQIDPSGWKGSVSNGLGADISLPHCLATGIWNLAPKATSGPKSRGASFGTTLWRHVQRYCAQFLLLMVIYGNLVLCGYNWNLQKPSLSCPRLFLWTLESFQIYCMEEIA